MWHTIGHDKAVRLLRRSLAMGRVSHAYLIVGPRRVGKMTLAMDFARALNCLVEDRPCGECAQCTRIAAGLHADIKVVSVGSADDGDGRKRVAIGIDQVRDVQREVSLKPYEGAFRVIIFDEAERFSEEAANALLKTLEEPPAQVVLFLLTAEPEGLPPTVISRCQRLDLRPVSRDSIARELEARYAVESATGEEIARLSGGSPGWAFQAAAQPDLLVSLSRSLERMEEAVWGHLDQRFSLAADLATSFWRDRASVRNEFELWLGWWRDVLLLKQGVQQFVTNRSRTDRLWAAASALSERQVVGAIMSTQETWELLERNVNPRLALEGLMLAWPRLEPGDPGDAGSSRGTARSGGSATWT